MLKWISRIGRPQFQTIEPAEPLAVIGDVHGCADLLDTLLDVLKHEAPWARPVFVGDLIDRGPDSRRVLERLRLLPAAVVLLGNHEEMMLDFLDAPLERGALWLRHGGIETLASFGIAAAAPDIATRDALRRALGAEREAWLRHLPRWWLSGNVAVVHAGADPRTPIAHQNPRHLVWGHPGFGKVARRDGIWVLHGHVVQSRPNAAGGIISVDTGAWRSGRLSAAVVTAGAVCFFTVGG